MVEDADGPDRGPRRRAGGPWPPASPCRGAGLPCGEFLDAEYPQQVKPLAGLGVRRGEHQQLLALVGSDQGLAVHQQVAHPWVPEGLAVGASDRHLVLGPEPTEVGARGPWVAAQGEDIVPLVGARTRERLAEALPAREVNLTADDLAEIEKAVPPGAARGDRYPSAFMSGLGVGN